MISKSLRMTRKDFDVAKKSKGTRLTAEGIVIMRFSSPFLKIGCVIPNKNAKTAVLRHSIKRFIYNTFLDMCAQKTGTYIVSITKPYTKQTFPLLQQSLVHLMQSL